MPKGITAELGRRLGFWFHAGPPKVWSIGVLRISWHSGLMVTWGELAETMEASNASAARDRAQLVKAKAIIAEDRHALNRILRIAENHRELYQRYPATLLLIRHLVKERLEDKFES